MWKNELSKPIADAFAGLPPTAASSCLSLLLQDAVTEEKGQRHLNWT